MKQSHLSYQRLLSVEFPDCRPTGCNSQEREVAIPLFLRRRSLERNARYTTRWAVLDRMYRMAVALRPVKETDVPAMAAIRALESGSETVWTDRISRYLSGQHSPQQALTARTAFVAIDGSDLVGFVAGHKTRRFGCHGELQWINVVREKRGLGTADQLMTKIGTWFVAQDARRICVNVDPANLTARRLYTRRGAQILNDYWMIWEDAQVMCASVDL
jgi:ribosomal protein S18 acetylase RimI-like enzyme